jgi:peptide/nickel transport system ATP-binding protein
LTEPLLEVQDLSVRFNTDDGAVHAVDRMSLALAPSQVLGIVGESGCGKSVTALSILGLLPSTATITGSARFEGAELLGASGSRLRKIRGRKISFVFQEPMTSLNPVLRIGDQIEEVVREHMDLSRRATRERVVELLDLVHIPDPLRRVEE